MHFDVWVKTLPFIKHFLMEATSTFTTKNMQTFSVLVKPNQKDSDYLFN